MKEEREGKEGKKKGMSWLSPFTDHFFFLISTQVRESLRFPLSETNTHNTPATGPGVTKGTMADTDWQREEFHLKEVGGSGHTQKKEGQNQQTNKRTDQKS